MDYQRKRIEEYYTDSKSTGVVTMLEKPEAINAIVTLMFTAFGVEFASEKLSIKYGHLHEELGLYKPLETIEHIAKVKVWYDGHLMDIPALLDDTDMLMKDICYNIYNPVIGCPMGCPYCYTSSINKQFHLIDDWMKPQFRGPYHIIKDADGNDVPELFMKRPKNEKPIAWMLTYYSDFGTWRPEWQKNVMEQIIAAINLQKKQRKYADTFTLMTKNPHGIDLSGIAAGTELYEVTIGCTVDKNENSVRIHNLIKAVGHIRPSIMIAYQPVLEYISADGLKELADAFGAEHCYVLIGPEISNGGHAKQIPFAWIKEILDTCDALGIPVAEHISLKSVVEEAGYTYQPERSGTELYEKEEY